MQPRFFPDAEARADLTACRETLRIGSRSFFAASLILPRRIREPASALYAFCRLADDAVDLSADPAAALAALHGRLDAAYAGRPWNDPVDRAIADVVARFEIPRALPETLFEGFAWDAAGRRYATLADLQAYGLRVAGTVGIMMSMLMGRRSAPVLARAADLGIAMQLTNIARDVGEDARAGRLYLPLDRLAAAGIDPEDFLRAPRPSQAVTDVVGDLLTVADDLYSRAGAGIARLPADCRPAIRAASAIYQEIGREIRAAGCNSVDRRAIVSGRRKLALVAAAAATVTDPDDALSTPPIPAARDLVLRVAAPDRPPPPRSIEARFVRVVDLFERLERADQARRVRPGA